MWIPPSVNARCRTYSLLPISALDSLKTPFWRSALPRPVSWLPRLHEIRRSVANSVRSHYARQDLELLFELQPRAAQKLLGMLPTVQVGTSRLVDREALHAFLDRVHEAKDLKDTSSVIQAAREEKQEVSRRRLRALVQYDHTPVTFASLPSNLTLERGRVEVRFQTVQELAEAMYFLARVLDGELVSFAREFEVLQDPPVDTETGVRDLFAELESMESRHSAQAGEHRS